MGYGWGRACLYGWLGQGWGRAGKAAEVHRKPCEQASSINLGQSCRGDILKGHMECSGMQGGGKMQERGGAG